MKNFPKSYKADKKAGSGNNLGILNILMLIFLLFNLVIRFGTIFYYPPYNGIIAGLLGGVALACLAVILFPRYLRLFLFAFGFSFFLFGFGSIDIQSRILELIVTCVAATLFVINCREGAEGGRLNRPLVILILCYVGLSLFSLLLLPLGTIVRDLWFFAFPEFFFYMFIGPPYGFYYPLSAVIRLILFVVLAVQISMTAEAQENYRWLFSAIFSGAVFCAFIGLLDFYGIVPLAWYRFGGTATPGVLHSTFGNRGWFGEFILISVPFVLIGFMSKIKAVWWKVLLFLSLVVCEIALLLAGGRSGWVSYPVVLFVCWGFFWFTKEGRLESFQFSWKDFVKVAISVPITIVISLLIVFQVLMPVADQFSKDKQGEKEKNYLTRQATNIVKPVRGGRYYTWGEGFNVGRESPIFGLGYESFNWQNSILATIPDSYYGKFRSRWIHQTPHSIFLSLFVSGGGVGLYMWFVMLGYALVNLAFDLVKEKTLFNTPVIICILSFHIFGIFQTMQYIPMIWSMIFLCLGYAMTIDEKVLPDRLRRAVGVLTKASVVLVAIGMFFYVSNSESRNLAQKYDLRIYGMEQDRDRFAGFFQHSQRWKYGDYRWCGKKGAIYLVEDGGQRTEDGGRRIEDERQGSIELEFYCRTPGMDKEPVEVTVSHEGKILDTIVFGGTSEERGARSKEQESSVPSVRATPVKQKITKGLTGQAGQTKLKAETIRRRYELPKTPGEEQRLDIEVSRTWIPHNHLGNFDRRQLGVGVKILRTQ